MGDQQLLAIYLRDHHAAAGGGVELARRVAGSNPQSAFGREAENLAAEIGQDRAALEDVMAAVGVQPSRAKDAGAWLGEKLGRLKLNGRVVHASPLSRVVELEALTVGITGKIGLWRALGVAQPGDRRLAPFDFAGLIARAEEQRGRVEALHRRAAEVAFAGADG